MGSHVGRLRIFIAAVRLDPSVVVDKHQHTALPDSQVQLVPLCSMPYKLAQRAVLGTL